MSWIRSPCGSITHKPRVVEIGKWENEDRSRTGALLSKADAEYRKIQARLSRLAELYVDGELDRAEYTVRKRELVELKTEVFAKKKQIAEGGVGTWLEPLRDLINSVRERSLPTGGDDLFELSNFVARVGSNLYLDSRKVLWDWSKPYSLLAERHSCTGWRSLWDDYRDLFESTILP